MTNRRKKKKVVIKRRCPKCGEAFFEVNGDYSERERHAKEKGHYGDYNIYYDD